jgi:hypothetical protein
VLVTIVAYCATGSACQSEVLAYCFALQLDKLSPKQMQWLMAAATYTQRAVRAAQQARAWLAARPLVIAALIVLFLALLLRWLGWA